MAIKLENIIGKGVRDYNPRTISNKRLVWKGGAAESLRQYHPDKLDFRMVSSRHVIMFAPGRNPLSEDRFDGRSHTGDHWPRMSLLPSGCEKTGWGAAGETVYTAIFIDPSVFPKDYESQPNAVEFQPGLFDGDPLSWQLADAIKAECEAGAPHGLLYAETAATLLSHQLLRLYSNADPKRLQTPLRGGLAPYQLKRVTDYIGDRLTDELSLGELAALVGLSAHHFCRAFKQSTGLPPHRWQIRQRVEKAKALMLDSELSLAEIASESGFSDQSHFTTVFRKAVGATPNAWRRATKG